VQGGAPRTGTVNAFNSIVGSTTNERVGSNASAPIVLSNGNYVLVNAKWTNGGALPGLGSITWGSGSAPTAGSVSVSNSLHGNDVNDALGSGGTVAFKNGRFVVQSPYWHYNGNAVGAVTFGTGKAGQFGPIALANSVIGTAVNGGTSMTSDYQANGDRLIVGRPASNIVTLFQLSDDSIFANGFEG
jgi:hypothetical protein